MSDNPWNFEHNYRPNWLVDSETRKQRMDTCNSCEYLTTIAGCSKCNCFMPAKVWLNFVNCPIRKWDAVSGIPEDFAQAVKEDMEKRK